MKLEPNLSAEIKNMEKEVDSRMKEVGGNKLFVGQKGKMAKKTTPPRKVDKVLTPPSKAKLESCANFLLFLKKFKILTHWVMFDASSMHGISISWILMPTFGYISYHSWQFLALEF
jgi:hypothetical protein